MARHNGAAEAQRIRNEIATTLPVPISADDDHSIGSFLAAQDIVEEICTEIGALVRGGLDPVLAISRVMRSRFPGGRSLSPRDSLAHEMMQLLIADFERHVAAGFRYAQSRRDHREARELAAAVSK